MRVDSSTHNVNTETKTTSVLFSETKRIKIRVIINYVLCQQRREIKRRENMKHKKRVSSRCQAEEWWMDGEVVGGKKCSGVPWRRE